MKNRILIIDDELAICTALSLALKNSYDVIVQTDPLKGLETVRSVAVDIVLLDLRIGNTDGLEVLKTIKNDSPQTQVIMMTAYGSIQSSVTAMQNGAYTYLTKPLDLNELKIFIEQALAFKNLNDRVDYLSKELIRRYQYGEMIGESHQMQNVFRLIDRVKDENIGVMLVGESGTGKELAARAIHYNSNRKEERFVAVNCAAIPDGLLEEEFFGHRKGSFTGAVSDSRGKIELADKGTLFLDEIGDMPLGLQGKLLRVLQEKEFSRIGDDRMQSVDIRVIAATNRDLKEMVKEGSFRQDLYYRLNVIEIRIPPLRERKEDIPALCSHFLEEAVQNKNRSRLSISKDAMSLLLAYDYPGNVRELFNILEYASVLSDGDVIGRDSLPGNVVNSAEGRRPPEYADRGHACAVSFDGMSLAQVEKLVIESSLKRHGGKLKKVAEELGISERGLRNKLRDYHLSRNEE